jgi:hypothetical protein
MESSNHIEVDLSTLGGVAFAIPAYDGKLVIELAAGLYYLGRKLGEHNVKNCMIYEKGNALIDYSRNKLVQLFMEKTTLKKLVFIDADISFKWEDIERLLAFSSKYDVVCGTYPVKQDDPKYFINPVFEEGKVVINEYGLVSIKGAGAGFLCIDRSVFERMKPYCKPFRVGEQDYIEYFSCGVQDGQLRGEDITFMCKWVDEFKGEVWLDPGIELSHIGMKTYDMKFSKYFLDFVRQAEELESKEHTGSKQLKLPI